MVKIAVIRSFMMETYEDFVVALTCLPVYLADLLQTDEEILLVHYKKKNGEPSVPPTATMDVSANSTMNLTGCPLEVDLNVLPSAAAYHLSGHRRSDEVQHIPMKLGTARKFLHDHKVKLEELVTIPRPVYCVCDGNDENRIVALGSYQSGGHVVRTLIFLEDCVDKTYPENNINSMIQKHTENIGTDTIKIDVKVSCAYELYGFRLSNNYVFENLENTGSVLIKGCWNSDVYNIPQYGATIEMMLQVIIGHENSIMYPLFQELVFLQHCLKLLSNKQSILDDAVISCSPFDVTNLKEGISDALHEVTAARKPFSAPNNLQDAIQNISEARVIDKLYNILKSCQKVSDLRICFSILFEMASETPVVFDDDKNTTVGKIINDVYSGKMIVPYLSAKQSLELLIELGIQKLKQNYFSLVKSSDYSICEQLTQKWNNVGSFMTESRRGTLSEHDLTRGYLQLRFLLNVHVLLEFLQLVELNCCFSKNVSLCVMKHAYNKYNIENKSLDLSMLDRKQLCDLVLPLTYADVTVIEYCSPMKWQMKMMSVQMSSSTTTIFHYSKKPIFPDSVYINRGDADASSGDIKETFFVTRLESYTDVIF